MSITNFQVCEEDLSPAILAGYLESEAIAVDTETMGLNPWRDRLCLVQLCDPTGNVTAIRIPKGQLQAPNLKRLMEAESVVKIFHFARFDVTQLRHRLGIETKPIFCTKIASKLARTYTSSHGLKSLVQELEGIELDKTAQSSDWGNLENLSEEQLQYAANDVFYLHNLRSKLTKMLEREERWELAKDCFSCLPVLISLDLMQYKDIFEH
ncbi:ribonuclease D [Gloeocapsa sp. PCC 73106]|uniref:ribonuclease D n=1 Tax=Gloeocapsa sp. PCC 73106 TaxID=102232 RepID=UPI0002AC09A5|nr:ribonuclease D [Gloeocapsa sp. PCC 73106]ELR97411.1 ribonuclease D [Gloeocapsa sp. PCC 73106]